MHITVILMILDLLNILCAATVSGFVFICILFLKAFMVQGCWKCLWVRTVASLRPQSSIILHILL